MRKNNTKLGITLISGIFLFLIFSLNYASATFTVSNPQTSLYTNIFSGTRSSVFNTSMCQNGQDFVVQISPTGCTPTIVRSDLLSQQDVPVFCPLVATQLNPLINVKAISSISFTGSYSKYVQSVGFYPAQAALNLNGQVNNYPILSNVGYVVLDLKQTPNESSMPDFVSGNLTATIAYNAQNALGIGTASLYLPQLTDSDWQSQYPNYEFWSGKAFLRATNIQGNTATIAVYDSNLNQINTVNLQAGQTSSNIGIPGFNYCSGTMKITLNSLQNANTRAELNVNGDTIEVAQGGSLLNNQCQVLNIQDEGVVQDVQITCNTDSGKQTFDLRLAPRVTLNINGQNRDVGLGDFLYNNGQMSVYLGYIGSVNGKSVTGVNGFQNLSLTFIELPNQGPNSKLSNDQLAAVANLMNDYSFSRVTGVAALDALINVGKTFAGAGEEFIRQIIQGQQIGYLGYGRPNPLNSQGSFDISNVYIVGFSSPQDVILNSQAAQYYQNASSSYQSVLNNYPTETYPSGTTPTLGEQALYQQILLSSKLNQKNTLSTLCTNFKQRYPTSTYSLSLCNDASALSSQSIASQYVSINGQSYLINLNGVYQPTYNDFGAQIDVKYPDGTHKTFDMIKDQSVSLNDTTNETIQLVNLGTTTSTTAGVGTVYTATVKIPVAALSLDTKVLQEGVSATITDPSSKENYVLTLENVNLKQYAQVSVIPEANNLGSQANFSFNIGIEKRAIQLTPDQIKENIKNTNASIAKWQAISSAMGGVISTLSTACLATDAVLTVKNFFENIGGTGIARQLVMTGSDGWNQRCAALVSSGNYSTQEQCFNDNSAQIDTDVNQMTTLINNQNTEIQKTQAPYTTNQGSLLGGSSTVDTTKFMQAYLPLVESSLGKVGSSVTNPENPSQSISVSTAQSLLSNPGCNSNIGISDAKNIELYSNVLSSSSSSDSLKTLAQQSLYSTLSRIQANSNSCQKQETLAQQLNIPSSSVIIGSFQKINTIEITNPQLFKNSPFASSNTVSGNYYLIFQDQGTGQVYLITYNSDGVVQNTYLVNENNTLIPYIDQSGKAVKNPLNVAVKIYSSTTYQNPYKNPEVQYFETSPYQGMPAIVPFDLQNGWYAAVKQVVSSTTATQSYTASGQVQSFYLCNVGQNGLEEFTSTTGDDICESINLGTGQPTNQFPGLDSNTATNLINKAESAIQQASKAYQSGVSNVVINGQNIKVGAPATNSPLIQCTDFMSPSDCNLLFNLCDPVVCPPSRCNFGGAYPVQDVVQTGIIGSTLLCLPNAREGIMIPVCLTGIKAGIDNWISIQQAYAECLQNQLDTGQTTGICDEINSIYMCNFFWDQAAPLANLAIPTITSVLAGESNPRGGGEYLSAQNAWNTAKQSVSYFTNTYGANSFKVFKSLSTSNIGTAICQNFASLTVPNGASLASQLSNPDSPPQFTGTFQEIPFTTATVPATSQYQVYYHIYAGANQGVYYSIYLQRSSGGSSYYQGTSTTQAIDSGYINAGNFTDQTKDFTAPSGYNQLCMNVNGQVDCGFQEVSTSFALNYVQNQYVASEANNTQITTESACVSGTSSAYSLLNANLQNGVTNTINPQIYNQGIVRVCATSNPGQGTDPNAGSQNSRWVEVGYCDTQNLKCWLDTNSVNSVLTSNGASNLSNQTIQSLENNYMTVLQSNGYLSNDQFDSDVQNITSQADSNAQLSLIQQIINNVFYNNQKAELLLLEGNAYGNLSISTQKGSPTSGSAVTGTSGSGKTLTPAILSSIMTSLVNCQCGVNCQEYANSLINAANTYGEDPVLLLSVMIQESNCNVDALASTSSGNSVGLMQINTYSDCSSLGVTSLTDVTSIANYDKNIQCGALILKNKYNSFSTGKPWSCDGTSVTYSGWDAAVRGYIGYSCTGNANTDVPSYVNDVDTRYTSLINLLNSQGVSITALTSGTSTTSSSSTSTASLSMPSSSDISNFNTYKSIFDKYSQQNLPTMPYNQLSKKDYEAFLAAIAQECNAWGTGSTDWLMCYNYGNTNYQGADNQVSVISGILKSVLSQQLDSSSSPYYSCISTTVLNDELSCVLSVLHTGNTNSNGFLGIGANTVGINYANSTLTLWNNWKNYFNSQ